MFQNETTFLQRAENFKSIISSFFAVNPQMIPLFFVLPENKCLAVSIKCTMSHKRSRPLASFQSRQFGIQTSYLGICSAKNSMVIEFITIW